MIIGWKNAKFTLPKFELYGINSNANISLDRTVDFMID